MATEHYSFFDSTDSDAREYSASEFAEFFGGIVSNGVGAGTSLEVFADGSGRYAYVRAGHAYINGYRYELREDSDSAYATLNFDAASTTLNRIDSVVVRLNTATATRTATLTVLKGTAATTPTAPAPTRSGDIYDIVLAHVAIRENVASVAASDITDTRDDSAICGRCGAKGGASADNVSAGTLAGKVLANASSSSTLTDKQVRNIVIATAEPDSAGNGDIWLSYSN